MRDRGVMEPMDFRLRISDCGLKRKKSNKIPINIPQSAIRNLQSNATNYQASSFKPAVRDLRE